MIDLPLFASLSLLTLLATLAAGLFARSRQPFWFVALIGNGSSTFIHMLIQIILGIVEGDIRDLGDLKFIGVLPIIGFWFTSPIALACAGMISFWSRWQGNDDA